MNFVIPGLSRNPAQVNNWHTLHAADASFHQNAMT